MEFPINSEINFSNFFNDTYKNQTIIIINDAKYLINALDVNDLVPINGFFKKYREYYYRLSNGVMKESILYKGCGERPFYRVHAFDELKRWFSNLNTENRLYLALYDE